MRSAPAVLRTALAATLLGALTAGCSTGDGTDGVGTGTGPGGSTAGAAKPGRYSALPEPCGSVSESTLRRVLPDAAPEAYRGTPAVTYDTGRRGGCSWQGTDAETGSTLQLSVDFERVISYDPEVSDDDRAALDFTARAVAAGLPDPDAPQDDTADGSADDAADDSADDAAAGEQDGAPADGREPDAADAPGRTDSEGEPVPRTVSGIGSEAYLDDRLSSTATGARREVTLAFRSANVIATVHYTRISPGSDTPPASTPLQDGAQRVGRHLAGGFDD
ncbi:hypothetical protein [Streptomyces sp. AA0539]|uniref:hypothetical protein n=1 Tax=Streptomyces sp. AA0539 TaxID=1210045 RepID=UPI00031954BB|nr:hypothetical protein [Streptomyces sp. AA0539]